MMASLSILSPAMDSLVHPILSHGLHEPQSPPRVLRRLEVQLRSDPSGGFIALRASFFPLFIVALQGQARITLV